MNQETVSTGEQEVQAAQEAAKAAAASTESLTEKGDVAIKNAVNQMHQNPAAVIAKYFGLSEDDGLKEIKALSAQETRELAVMAATEMNITL